MNASRKSWPTRISTFCLVCAVMLVLMPASAALATRFGLINYGLGVPAAGLGMLAAIVMLVLTLVLLGIPQMRPCRGRLFLSLLLFLPGTVIGTQMILKVRNLPVIHDISTDLDDPPTFIAAQRWREAGDNSLDIDTEVLAQQQAAYQDISSKTVATPAPAAFSIVADAAEATGWQLTREDSENLEIEAVATTFWFGFKDDVIIRLRELDGKTRIDMRSVSRVGRSDLGANAARIRDFLAELESQLDI